MKILGTNYDTATAEELAKLKRTIKLIKSAELRTKIDQPEDLSGSSGFESQPSSASLGGVNGNSYETPASTSVKEAPLSRPVRIPISDFSAIANVTPTREPLKFANPVELFMVLMPEITLYKWQVEELLLLSGYLTPGDLADKSTIDKDHTLLHTLSAANGSGKDLVVIAIFAVWFALTGLRNRIIITSSSFLQIEKQTEVHIREFVQRANKQFGKIFQAKQFHYIVPELGSEIQLFATDEPGRAEGWHPYPGGKMALVVNEAKSIHESLFDALDRCTEYSYLLYISSPGRKRGRMYKSVTDAICYPAPAVLGQFYFRRVTAYDCPHIPKAHIERLILEKGLEDPWVRSSIFAEFSDYDDPVIITEETYDKFAAMDIKPRGTGIGIGLDLALGGDEIYCYVRQGNHLIFKFGFRQKNSLIAVAYIDKQLDAWRNSDYVFRADNGGLGQPMIDMLINLKWRIRRTNNQSPAFKKSEFLNLGAEMYFHTKRLIERGDIILPTDDPIFKAQLISRRFKGEDSAQGKFALESKKEHIASGLSSPDRADSFVLCFASYHVDRKDAAPATKGPKTYTTEELLKLAHSGSLFKIMRQTAPPTSARKSQIQKV